MIQIGQTLPDVQLSQRTSEGTLTHSVTTLFANKKSYYLPFQVPSLRLAQKRIYLAMSSWLTNLKRKASI